MRSASTAGVPRPVRWSLWLLAGVATGLVVGFAVGLARPRAKASP